MQPVIDVALGPRISYLEAKWNRTAELRNSRFGSTLRALDRLIKWTKANHTSAYLTGLPQVDEIRQSLDNLDNELDSDECDGDEDEAAGHPRCLQINGFVVADLVETNVFMHDSHVYDAAVALAESLEQLGKHEQTYVAEDL